MACCGGVLAPPRFLPSLTRVLHAYIRQPCVRGSPQGSGGSYHVSWEPPFYDRQLTMDVPKAGARSLKLPEEVLRCALLSSKCRAGGLRRKRDSLGTSVWPEQ